MGRGAYGWRMGEVIPFPRRSRDERQAERSVPTGPARPSTRRPPREQLWRTLVGSQLREERARRAETLAAVAARAGISVQYLSELERGRKEPSSEVLAAVARALDLTLLDLTVGVARDLHSQRISAGRPTGPVALAA